MQPFVSMGPNLPVVQPAALGDRLAVQAFDVGGAALLSIARIRRQAGLHARVSSVNSLFKLFKQLRLRSGEVDAPRD